MNYLILCTGNTCRSPMAAAILQRILKEKGDTTSEVISAGLQALDGLPANPNAVAAKVVSLDVQDPFGQDLDTYRRCRDELKEKLQKLVNP